MTKQEIRDKIKAVLAKQKPFTRKRKSDILKTKLFRSPEFKRARVVMFFISRRDEPDTLIMMRDALRAGKRVVAPLLDLARRRIVVSELKSLEGTLERGPYGILQPKKSAYRKISTKKLDLVLVPGVAFTRRGVRLGRGGGYYDRFLAAIPKRTPFVGLAFKSQIVKSLPTLSHDIRLAKIISA